MEKSHMGTAGRSGFDWNRSYSNEEIAKALSRYNLFQGRDRRYTPYGLAVSDPVHAGHGHALTLEGAERFLKEEGFL
jgi:hypothetical protein